MFTENLADWIQLYHRIGPWCTVMRLWLLQVWIAFRKRQRFRRRLVAENLILRHQINILKRELKD